MRSGLFSIEHTALAVAREVALGSIEKAVEIVDGVGPEELQEIVAICKWEGLLPFLALAVQRSEAHARLRRQCAEWVGACVGKDILVEQVIGEAVQALQRAGIRFLLIKGACFRTSLYPQPWLRQMTDIDILVHKDDVGKAVARLCADGFQRYRSYPERPISMRFSSEKQFHHGSGLLLELHSALTPEPVGLNIDWNSIFVRAIKAPCGPAPAWEDHLLLLAIHQARTGMTAGVRPYLDMAAIAEKQGVDWDAAAFRAKEWGCSAALFFALEAARGVFGLQVPERVLVALRPPGLRGAMLRALCLAGTGQAAGKRVRIDVLAGVSWKWFHKVWRPLLYALMLDYNGQRMGFTLWVSALRSADLLAFSLTRTGIF